MARALGAPFPRPRGSLSGSFPSIKTIAMTCLRRRWLSVDITENRSLFEFCVSFIFADLAGVTATHRSSTTYFHTMLTHNVPTYDLLNPFCLCCRQWPGNKAIRSFTTMNSPGGSFDLSISMATMLIISIQIGVCKISASFECPNEITLMHCASNLRRSGYGRFSSLFMFCWNFFMSKTWNETNKSRAFNFESCENRALNAIVRKTERKDNNLGKIRWSFWLMSSAFWQFSRLTRSGM